MKSLSLIDGNAASLVLELEPFPLLPERGSTNAHDDKAGCQ